jgi:hypothetical protein
MSSKDKLFYDFDIALIVFPFVSGLWLWLKWLW